MNRDEASNASPGTWSGIAETVRNLRVPAIGKIMFKIAPMRRATVNANLRIAFGAELNEQELDKLAAAFYGHIAVTFWENLRFAWISQNALKNHIRVEGMDNLIDASLKHQRGMLLLGGHFGNWELAPMAGSLHYPEFRGRLHILRRQLVNKTVERILFRRFYQMGLDIIPKRNSLARVMDALSRSDAVGFIMDQFAKPGKEGLVANFFGKPAGTFKSLALVARSSGAPVLPAYSWREAPDKHVFRFEPPLTWIDHPDSDEEIRLNTENYNRVLERIIRQHPEQWLWLHKRWKDKGMHMRPTDKLKV